MDVPNESNASLDLDDFSDGEISDDQEYVPDHNDHGQDSTASQEPVPGKRMDGEEREAESKPDEMSNDGDECNSDDQSSCDRNEVLDDLQLGNIGNLTHASIGENSRALPCLPLVASMPKTAWLEQLKTTGYAGLLYPDMKSLREQPRFELEWWFKNKDDLTRRLVKTTLVSVPNAGVFTLRETLPGASVLNSVLATVAELVASDQETAYCASTLQLFIPSEGGFSQDFRQDEFSNCTDLNVYRCFWYLGPNSLQSSSVERDGIFIGSAGSNVQDFSRQKVVSLAGFYGEADRKFRLHPGDILVMDTTSPFAVDLPIGGRAKGARVLSWLVFPKQDSTSLPTVAPDSEIVMNIEDILDSNNEAREFYSSEMDSLEINPGPIGDPEGFMQRLRVTPSKYELKDVNEEVENNPSILYLDTDYFSSQ